MLMLVGTALSAVLIAGAGPAARVRAAPAAPVLLAQAVPAELKVSDADHALGKPDAPVTIIEYASMTCPHCAAFHTGVLPELKKKYVDSGKVRFVYRDFPLDRVALQAAQIAECAGNDRYFAILDLVFATQAQWTAGKEPIEDLARSLRIAGVTPENVKTCLADDKVLTAIVAERQVGEKVGVNATPTLFLNGQRWTGGRTFEALDDAVSKLLK
jgi:protein-disulfide isomerase